MPTETPTIDRPAIRAAGKRVHHAPSPSRTQRIRAALTGRQLVAGLLFLLLVPTLLGAAALSYDAPAPPPAEPVEQHTVLPQVPDSVARAQLDRSERATRVERKLTAPTLLSGAALGSTNPAELPTIAMPPRPAPYTLAELRALLPVAFSDLPATPGSAAAVVLNANVEVPVGATLVIDAQTPDVRLASTPAAFATIISRGTLDITGTDDSRVRISSWDPQQAAPDGLDTDGRAFVLQQGGRMDIDQAQLSYLGFGTGTSSGVAWRGAPGATAADRVRAQGVVTGSEFDHNHFGAYTHEAQGMRFTANTFHDNQEYGFDPHDYSNDFVVDSNTAYNNGKHGFIFSRGCDRNVLSNNTAYNNTGHGFMIDDGRSVDTPGAEARIDPSNNNVITHNTAYDNRDSGVEIEGGTGNVVSHNTLTRNDIGVRIKDNAAATVTDNVIADSDRYGINILDTTARVPVDNNQISGSWAAINLESDTNAAVGTNPTTEVSTPLVVAGVATHTTTWTDQVIQYLRWNPMLLLWGLILGLPVVAGLIETLVIRPGRAVHGS